jgi:hypothetical protein
MGERLSGFIYGTIVVLAALVGGAKAYPQDAGLIATLVLVTTVVFWLAHVYAHGLGRAVSRDEHLSAAELRHIARREGAIIEAAVPPLGALLLGALGLFSTAAAVWTAFGLGLLVLATAGIAFARVERLAWLGTLVVVAANVALGLLLLALKLVLHH